MIFKSGFRITQAFGSNPDYYKQFGFAGHEGLDLVPKTKGDNEMFCVEDGEVLRDVDDPKSGAYGIHTVIWNKEKKRAFWYCHLAVNYVENKKVVKKGDKIGVMGATGNTNGAHLHLNLRLTDASANPINTGNGYKGFVDPLPVLQQLEGGQDMGTITIPIEERDRLIGRATAIKEVAEYLKIANPDQASAEEIKRVIGGIQSGVTTAQRERDEARVAEQNAKDELSRVREELIKSNTSLDSLTRQVKAQQEMLDRQGREIGGLNTRVQALETENRELKKGNTQSLTFGDVFSLLIKKLFTGKL